MPKKLQCWVLKNEDGNIRGSIHTSSTCPDQVWRKHLWPLKDRDRLCLNASCNAGATCGHKLLWPKPQPQEVAMERQQKMMRRLHLE